MAHVVNIGVRIAYVVEILDLGHEATQDHQKGYLKIVAEGNAIDIIEILTHV